MKYIQSVLQQSQNISRHLSGDYRRMSISFQAVQ